MTEVRDLTLEEIKRYDDSWWLRYLTENTIFDTENIRAHKEWLIKQVEAEKERADRVTEERARFNQVYEMLLKKFKESEEQEKKLREAIVKCLIAGNSLACVIMSYELPNGHETWTKEDAISYFYEEHGRDIAYERYETWLAWKAIKDVSTSLDKEEEAK